MIETSPVPAPVEELSPSAHAEWDAFVAAHPGGNPYHLTAWKRAVEGAYGARGRFLVVREGPGGPIRGGLPLFIVGPWIRRYAVSGPFGAYAPVLARSPAEARALVEAALRIARAARANNLTLKLTDPVPDGIIPDIFHRHDGFVIGTLALPDDPERLWRGFRDKIRNAVRKAERSDLRIERDPQHLGAFYDVLAENMHRKGTPIYGLQMMQILLESLGDFATIYTIWKDGRAISGAFSVHFRGISYVPFASSRPGDFKYNPNNLLYWTMLRDACLRGDHTFDFGRSARDTSTLAFKTGWGATVQSQPYYVATLRGAPPPLSMNPTIERLTRLWARLPRGVADRLGPIITGRLLV